jgi:3-hydroxymyristoyl/3-hydroxydecanoyl-(acyl carrier protein) dehydratase
MNKKCISGKFFFDQKYEIFKTHFPGYPVVPGTMIVASFINLLQKNYNLLDLEVENFKFLKFIPPGEYLFKITIDHKKAKCELYQDKNLVARGKIYFKK